MKQIQFEIDGRLVEGSAVLRGGTLWAHINGRTFVVESASRTRRGGKAGGSKSNPNEIAAPMPGKIIKLMVKPGDSVRAGDVVIVMEAMKMEYTLKAQADAVVSEIFCAPNEQVPLGQMLAKFKPKADA